MQNRESEPTALGGHAPDWTLPANGGGRATLVPLKRFHINSTKYQRLLRSEARILNTSCGEHL
jgi:hypothetical protein